jgi:hypothetical protein
MPEIGALGKRSLAGSNEKAAPVSQSGFEFLP